MIWTSSQLELRLFKCCIRRNFETGTLENIHILLACFRTNLLSLKITSWYRLIVFIILLKIKAFKIVSRYALNNAMYHGLRTPNGGINQRYLKNWADVADKICFGHTYKFGSGSEFSVVQWRLFPLWASVVRAMYCHLKSYSCTSSGTRILPEVSWFWQYPSTTSNNYLDWDKCQNRHSSKSIWVMPILIFNPVLIIITHPLLVHE